MKINHLIILTKNVELGKVKTRLANTVGDEKALAVYKELLKYTHQVTQPVQAQKKCYYSSFIENNDIFEDQYFEKEIQRGVDLGERMYNAAKNSFGEWANKVVLIGSDCFDINSDIIEEAFIALDEHDVVLGPAIDGGYYLIGMKELHSEFFLEKEWSHENVMLDTIITAGEKKLKHYLLPTLSDVDYYEDLPERIKKIIA
ncbi:MAG: rSAM/selenodomain-associated transferase 1 [Parvicella sp.]|jgi:rSAM/selenodomain-associated transferase 1